jgi:hypothetical protein
MHNIICYRLDADDCIVEVGGDWEDFASANEAPHLLSGNVIGQSLWDFVRGRSLQELYRTLLEHVRTSGKNLRFAYRCDSPDERRYMDMELLLQPHNIIEFRSRLVRSETNPLPLRVRAAATGSAMFVRCSICNRLCVNDRWLETRDAVSEGLFVKGSELRVVFGVCQPCKQDIYAEKLA